MRNRPPDGNERGHVRRQRAGDASLDRLADQDPDRAKAEHAQHDAASDGRALSRSDRLIDQRRVFDGGHVTEGTAPAAKMDVVTSAPFGRGWTTLVVTVANVAVLALLSRSGAGPFGFVALPFLLGDFVLTGALATRFADGALRRLWAPVRWTMAGVVGIGGFAAGFASWATTPSDADVLAPMFTVLAVAAALWAAAAPAPARRAAILTALATVLAAALTRLS